MACCRCQRYTSQPVLVGIPFANSGAGGPAWYACLPCARVDAASPMFPDWLGEEIAKAEARLDAP